MFDHIKQVDHQARRKRLKWIGIIVLTLAVAGGLYYQFKNYREERTAAQFFEALQRQDYQEAYRLWQPRPTYKFNDFSDDWGPEGLLGRVEQFDITSSSTSGTGVVVRVQVNDRLNVAVRVERRNQSLSFPPDLGR